jgi:DNA-binding transcriptional ArsR family regulator
MRSAAAVEDRIFQALADPSRRAIFEALTRGEVAVKDLTARFDISQPAISQHLATLKDAGLVNGRREGRCVYYRVEPRGMKPLIDWIAHYRAFWADRVDRLERLLEKMDE